MLSALLLGLLTAEPAPRCKTVADCWLDERGKAVARPKSKQGRPIPRGDCGKNILWLRHRLACEQSVCVAVFVGDEC